MNSLCFKVARFYNWAFKDFIQRIYKRMAPIHLTGEPYIQCSNINPSKPNGIQSHLLIWPQLWLNSCQRATKVQKPKFQFHLNLWSKHVKWSHSNDMERRRKGRWEGRGRGPPGGKTNLDIHRSGEQSPPGETMPVINKGWQSELSINTVCMAWANLLCKQLVSLD